MLKREDIGGKVLRSAWLLRSCLTGDFTAVTIRQEAIIITVQVSGSCEGTENELHGVLFGRALARSSLSKLLDEIFCIGDVCTFY